MNESTENGILVLNPYKKASLNVDISQFIQSKCEFTIKPQ